MEKITRGAGVSETAPAPYIPELVKQRIGDAYTAGASLEEVAQETGFHVTTVTAALAELRITLRPEPAVDRTQYIREIVADYAAGLSIRAIARARGRGYGTIHRILSENTTMRPRGAPSAYR